VQVQKTCRSASSGFQILRHHRILWVKGFSVYANCLGAMAKKIQDRTLFAALPYRFGEHAAVQRYLAG
jgi:hypothetical protein